MRVVVRFRRDIFVLASSLLFVVYVVYYLASAALVGVFVVGGYIHMIVVTLPCNSSLFVRSFVLLFFVLRPLALEGLQWCARGAGGWILGLGWLSLSLSLS